MDLDPDLDLDLDLDLDNYLLHPQSQHGLRIVHAFMRNRTIEHVVQEKVEIEGGVLRQEQLIWCIKRQQQQQRALRCVHFKLRAMFLYNMDLAAQDLLEFLRHPRDEFITPISAVEDVAVRPTIPMFAGMNALHIMYEGNDGNGNGNAGSGNGSGCHCNTKKRIVMQSNKHKHKHKHNRTRRESGQM
jgi:hypothetical protein